MEAAARQLILKKW